MPIDINKARAAKAAKKPASAEPAKGASAAAPVPAARQASAALDPGAMLESRTSAKLTDVAPNPLNPRRIDLDSSDMVDLRASLKDRGQLSPVAVVTAEHFRRIFDGTSHAATIGAQQHFVIVGGGRRHAALTANRAASIKITVLHGSEAPQTQADWLAVTVAENIQREQLSVMETARSIRDLREYNSGREVADILRKTPGWVSLYMGLNDLPPEVVAVIESAPFSLRQARRVYDRSGTAARLREAENIRAELLGIAPPPSSVDLPDPASAGPGGEEGAQPTPSKGGRKAQSPERKAIKAVRSIVDDHGQEVLVAAILAVLDEPARRGVAAAIAAAESTDRR